jgi:hypothetical protein
MCLHNFLAWTYWSLKSSERWQMIIMEGVNCVHFLQVSQTKMEMPDDLPLTLPAQEGWMSACFCLQCESLLLRKVITMIMMNKCAEPNVPWTRSWLFINLQWWVLLHLSIGLQLLHHQQWMKNIQFICEKLFPQHLYHSVWACVTFTRSTCHFVCCSLLLDLQLSRDTGEWVLLHKLQK